VAMELEAAIAHAVQSGKRTSKEESGFETLRDLSMLRRSDPLASSRLLDVSTRLRAAFNRCSTAHELRWRARTHQWSNCVFRRCSGCDRRTHWLEPRHCRVRPEETDYPEHPVVF